MAYFMKLALDLTNFKWCFSVYFKILKQNKTLFVTLSMQGKCCTLNYIPVLGTYKLTHLLSDMCSLVFKECKISQSLFYTNFLFV